MDLHLEILIAIKVIVATIFGSLIGWEREHHGCDAGLRTYASVTLGACIFGIVSAHAGFNSDPGRIAAQVVTGVGFLGVGVIMRRDKGKISGLTTAASLWSSAAVGLAVAFDMYILAALSTVILLIILVAYRLPISTHKHNFPVDKEENDA